MSSPELLPHIELIHNPNNRPIDRAVIWLHGLGASGDDFVPVVPELGLDGSHGVRFIFPHAPRIAVTVNGGYVMPAWYDILEINLSRKVDRAQIAASAQRVRDLMAAQNAQGIDTRHIVLAGFSQGGAVAYHTALSHHEPLAGLLALSTYLATQDDLATLSPNQHATNHNLPIAIHHGTQDHVVPETLGQQARDWLSAHGYAPTYHTYPMAHQVCLPEIKTIGRWLNQLLA
ncbi:alpha/beta hydrolase [Moraxella atlantae]|uniref:alpha/beta hydrolase n=1 Tax=Faucicola atlantae TaxID=34059 RepID=UPI003751276E